MLETEDERNKFNDAYEMHRYKMLKVAMSILWNNNQAEDCVQEAFIAIIKHKKKYLSISCPDLGIPLVIITMNKCFDVLRRANYKDENIDDHEYYLKSDEDTPEKKLLQKEDYETLRNHMQKLDDESINVLEMRYVLKMSHKEISESTGLSLDNINKKITRAKAKIRALYAEGCEE